jgi:uncharacterized protein (DUF362 family)
MSDTHRTAGARQDMSRREFVGAVAGGMAALSGTRARGATGYRVARINSSDPYAGTMSALAGSGEFPAVAGRTVVIKPNLVSKRLAETGVTTDPQVVRAIVDHALGAGAAAVKIIEGGARGANFDECGYAFFGTYDLRVALTDVNGEALSYAAVPPATPPAGTSGAPAAYQGLYLPTSVLGPDVVFISAAKMKTHAESMATLALKNLYGVPPHTPYMDPAGESYLPRFKLHDRSLGQTIASLALTRPIDYAVVDGVWGLEGNGPVDVIGGTPIEANVIVGGRNALAVDLACIDLMGIARSDVQHLEYAYLSGLGPADLSQIELVGDPVTVPPFAQPVIPPKVWCPRITPAQFSVSGGRCTAAYRLMQDAQVQIQVLRTSDRPPSQALVRTLQPWTDVLAGNYSVQWDGRDDLGQPVAPTLYGVRVQARREPAGDSVIAAGINWVTVTA